MLRFEPIYYQRTGHILKIASTNKNDFLNTDFQRNYFVQPICSKNTSHVWENAKTNRNDFILKNLFIRWAGHVQKNANSHINYKKKHL